MSYRLVPAVSQDETWLEGLRRVAYQELLTATFGGWDEARHMRQFRGCWQQGGISIIELDGVRVGMIQLCERPEGLEVSEIQILSNHQNRGIGSHVLRDTITQAHRQRRSVSLSVGLKNDRAYRLYLRLGFHRVASSDTHHHLSCDPSVSA